ncbi:right-handed parallel beta-helix repeat-containing protein [Stappia taiwanensis]|nr:right-handed parallel beta-helix repeat-containing protein [Stappia taiwanensis]
MAQPYPLPRETRSSGVLVCDGTSATYGPFDFHIFDIEDVVVDVRHSDDAGFSRDASVTVTKTSGSTYDTFSITFDHVHPITTSFVVYSARTPERSVALFMGGGLKPSELEKELSKTATTLQELRRDLGRAMIVQHDRTPPVLNIPANAGRFLVTDEAGNLVDGGSADDIATAAENAVMAAAAADAAQMAAADAAATAAQIATARFDTCSDVQNARISARVSAIYVAGYYLPGDGGGGLYTRFASEPVNAGWLKSADGAFWRLSVRQPTPRMYGARFDAVFGRAGSVSASATTFNSALAIFKPEDVGKIIGVEGAGAGGTELITVIASVNSSTSVELSDAASTSVFDAEYCYGSDDTAALQAWLDAIPEGGGARIDPGTALFTATLTKHTSSYAIQTAGAGSVRLVYAGPSAVVDLFELGDGVATVHNVHIQSITVDSIRKMTSGTAVHLRKFVNSELSIDAMSQERWNAVGQKLNHGVWFDAVDNTIFDPHNIWGCAGTAVIVNGALSGPKAGLFFRAPYKIARNGIAVHLAGGFGGLYLGDGDYIKNDSHLLVDQSIVAERNRELFLLGGAYDVTNYGPCIDINDPGNLLIQMSRTWIASSATHGLHVRRLSGRMEISGGCRFFNCGADGIRVDDALARINIGDSAIHDNSGYGINTNVSDHGVTYSSVRFSNNTSGEINSEHPCTEVLQGSDIIRVSSTWDIPSTAADAHQNTTVVVPGARLGDTVIVNHTAVVNSNMQLSGCVSSPGVISVRFHNRTPSTQDLVTGALKITLIRHA